MTELLLKPARQTGCSDLPALQEAVDEASHRQSSPLDGILDSGSGRRGALHGTTLTGSSHGVASRD